VKYRLLILHILFLPGLLWAQEARLARDIDFPEAPFRLLQESFLDPCSACAKTTAQKAFRLLDQHLQPGIVYKTGSKCKLIKTDHSNQNELVPTCGIYGYLGNIAEENRESPILRFRFHTEEHHLVGVSSGDFTQDTVAEPYNAAESGTIFEGAIRIVKYDYGDGASFVYNRTENHIQVHCVLLELVKGSSLLMAPCRYTVRREKGGAAAKKSRKKLEAQCSELGNRLRHKQGAMSRLDPF